MVFIQAIFYCYITCRPCDLYPIQPPMRAIIHVTQAKVVASYGFFVFELVLLFSFLLSGITKNYRHSYNFVINIEKFKVYIQNITFSKPTNYNQIILRNSNERIPFCLVPFSFWLIRLSLSC